MYSRVIKTQTFEERKGDIFGRGLMSKVLIKLMVKNINKKRV